MGLESTVLEIAPSPEIPNPNSSSLLIEAIVAEAWADADRIAAFLKEFGSEATDDSRNPIDRDTAIFLGAFLRLAYWERLGLGIHLQAGLPSASQALADACQAVTESGSIPWADELWASVLKVFVRHFAWHGRGELGAAITIDSLDEEAALDALARLLWERRRHRTREDS